ncbi:MAG: DUF6164 family protein [Mariprofundaceae bacterium]|nr:DUF6164 family protein [Mariprofundaceae bacterium]
MPVLLFKLRHVPDDEIKEVCELLDKNHIDYYETTAGSWGISLPALWLHDDLQLDAGKQLILAYQAQREKGAKALYQSQCQLGEQRTYWTLMKEAPLKYLAYLFAILFVLYLATIPVSFLFQ